jgi:hypothetical protein
MEHIFPESEELVQIRSPLQYPYFFVPEISSFKQPEPGIQSEIHDLSSPKPSVIHQNIPGGVLP